MVELILTAAARVLERESLAGFNTNRVAEVAGISVGSLYQYFPNKDALVAALIARAQSALADAFEALMPSLDTLPLERAVRALARFAIEQQYGKPLLAAALDHEERRLPVDAIVNAATRRIVGCAERLIATHRDELPRAVPAAAASDLLTIGRAMVEAEVGRAREAPADLEDRVVRALLGYLRCSR